MEFHKIIPVLAIIKYLNQIDILALMKCSKSLYRLYNRYLIKLKEFIDRRCKLFDICIVDDILNYQLTTFNSVDESVLMSSKSIKLSTSINFLLIKGENKEAIMKIIRDEKINLAIGDVIRIKNTKNSMLLLDYDFIIYENDLDTFYRLDIFPYSYWKNVGPVYDYNIPLEYTTIYFKDNGDLFYLEVSMNIGHKYRLRFKENVPIYNVPWPIISVSIIDNWITNIFYPYSDSLNIKNKNKSKTSIYN